MSKHVKPGLRSTPLAKRRRAVNLFLNELGKKYHDAIPLNRICQNLEKNGFLLLDEDGTPWSGFLVGSQGEAHFFVCDIPADAGYFYIRRRADNMALAAMILPKEARKMYLNSIYCDFDVEETTFVEYETFNAFGANTDDPIVKKFGSIMFKPSGRTSLRLTWYKMSSGRYEIVAYMG